MSAGNSSTVKPGGDGQGDLIIDGLAGITFNHVLVNPVQRARQTCVLAGFNPAAQQEPDLQEWDYGDYEGKTTAEIRELRPGWDVFHDGCPSGESVEDIRQRTDRIIEVLHPLDGVVALFAHGHFLRALATRWIGLPLAEARHFSLDPASISILGHQSPEENLPIILLWNAAAHPRFASSKAESPTH